MDVPPGATQEEGHTGFLIHLPSTVPALIFIARRIQPFLSLLDREVEFCQTFVSTRVLVVSPTFVYSTLLVPCNVVLEVYSSSINSLS